MPLKIYLSYSPTKSHNPESTKTAVQLVKDIVAAHKPDKWICLDPMVDPGTSGIRDKVEAALLSADALIAECSTSVPNVMFEIGFARACGYPLIVLVNTDAFNNERLRTYFDFLKHHEDTPLASDLGDVEFLQYSDTISFPAEAQNFTRKLKYILNKLASRLSPGARLLSQGVKDLRKTTLDLTDRHESRPNPPLLRLLGGWLAQVVHELQRAGIDSFEVDSEYYENCFSQFLESERDSALAIADFSDPTEQQIWDKTDSELQMAVHERIFLIDGNVLQGDDLNKAFHALRRHVRNETIENYGVFVARANHPDQPPHIFKDAVSRDLLLIPPDVVGGYVKKGARTYLRLETSESRYRQAESYYKAFKDIAFSFDITWTRASDLRAAWLRAERLGAWNTTWNFDTRTEDYYINYDMNIRCWIPDYESLIEATGAEIIHICEDLQASDRRGAKIMEVGTGTGALSATIYRLLDQNPDFEPIELCRHYFCVDKSIEMLQLVENRISHMQVSPMPEFELGTAFSALGRATLSKKPYDIICGSLVLTHILQYDIEGNLSRMLNFCKKLLHPMGCLVLADSLFLDPDDRERGRAYWQNWMLQRGLSCEIAERFFVCNKEMIETVTLPQLNDIGERYGFSKARVVRVPGSAEASPFQIVVMPRTIEKSRQ